MGDDRKAEYEMAPTSDPENPDPPAEKAELGTEEDGSQQWSGLSKEELLRVADTPAWNWTRNILLILFWIAWVLMLVVAIILVVKAPSCPHVEWHEKSPIYQIYLRSFKDTDNDGYGDLGGLIYDDNVAKIKENFGAETILLSPVFKQVNGSTSFGKETVDFMDIDPSIGTREQFGKLIEAIQFNGMHLILEFDPNHSSDQHDWFQKSREGDEHYRDYYIWADAPIDEWKNYKGESAWTLDDVRDQYYYHFYEASQPDLNFNNENVTSEIKKIMKHWLVEMKVDGFVLANFDRLVEPPVVTVGRKKRQVEGMATDGVTELPPDMMMMTTPVSEMMDGGDGGSPGSPEPSATDGGYPTQYESIGQATTELPKEVAELLEELYQVVYENSYLGKYRVLIPQHSGTVQQNVLYERKEWQGFPMCLSFASSLKEEMAGHDISKEIEELKVAKEKAGLPVEKNSWAVGHSGISRLASRTGGNARALLMLMFALPGTPMPYYGEELGLVDLDGVENGWLGPYPWSNRTNGNFSTDDTTEPWMPAAKNVKTVNIEAQLENMNSDLAYFKNLSKFRREPSLLAGVYDPAMVNSDLFSFTRYFEGWPRYLVVINVGEKQEGQSIIDDAINGTVVLSASGDMMDKEVQLNKLTISGNDAFLIRYEQLA